MNELFLQNWVFTGKGYGTSLDDILKNRFLYYGVPFVDPCGGSTTCAPALPSLPPNAVIQGLPRQTAVHFNAAVETLLTRITELEARVLDLETP